MHCRSTKQRRAALRRRLGCRVPVWNPRYEELAFQAMVEQFLASMRKNYRVFVDEARRIPPNLYLPDQYQVKVSQGSQTWPEQSKIAMCSDLELALVCDPGEGVKTVPFEEIKKAEVTDGSSHDSR